MKIEISKGDITEEETEALVNAANNTLLGGGGVDGAIHRIAGPGLLQECRGLGGCATGEAVITQGYDLKASYVIHTVGPVWRGGSKGEEGLLTLCYSNCLKLALEKGIKSISFPAISTGIYGFPIERATQIALSVVQRYVAEDLLIRFICFSEADEKVYLKTLGPY